MSKSQEVMDRIAETIIEDLAAGVAQGKWQKPWVNRTKSGGGVPINAITRKRYTGGNVFYLWMTGWAEDRTSGEWATYKQWESIGAQVRKGERGTQTVRWNVLACKDHGPDERCHSCGRMVPNVFTLFNADQVDGYEPKDRLPVNTEHHNPCDPIPTIDQFFANVGADVFYGSESACYIPSADRIKMPDFDAFIDAESFYGTLAHEHIHWTGAESRANRDMTGRFGDEKYATEELIAELGSAMLCGLLGIEDKPRPDHAQYLAHWVSILREDHKVLWSAASKATKAVEFICSLVPAKEEVAA